MCLKLFLQVSENVLSFCWNPHNMKANLVHSLLFCPNPVAWRRVNRSLSRHFSALNQSGYRQPIRTLVVIL